MTLGGVDDWLKSELRRAERQGLLTGRHLSPIQFNATIILNYIDTNDKALQDLVELKRALLASGSYNARKLFPDELGPETETVEDTPDAPLHGTPDYSDVDWKSPSDSMEEFEKLMAEVAKLQDGKITGDGFVERDPDEGWK